MKIFIVLALLLQTACSTLPTHKPISPTVVLTDIDIVKFGLMTQELAITLDVFNPNNYDLPVNTLEFTASSEQQAFASGGSTERVLLTAKVNTPVTINVTARTNKALRRLIASYLNKERQVNYNVKGFIKLDNWPARIPFDVDKALSFDDT